jgi:nucleotide-binding universal stress UspA family protein
MIAVTDGQSPPTAEGHRPCLLGHIADETAARRGAMVAHAVATVRDTDLLRSGASSTAADIQLPPDHRDAYSRSATAVTETRGIEPTVDRRNPSALVVERETGAGLLSELRGTTPERLADRTDVLTVDGRGNVDTLASILVPVAGGRHSQLAVETARAIAAATDAAIDLFHVVEADGTASRERGEQILATAATALGEFDNVDTWLYEADSVAGAIIEQSTYYDLTVMGAPTVGPLERFVFGSTSTNVQRDAESPVVVAHAHSP